MDVHYADQKKTGDAKRHPMVGKSDAEGIHTPTNTT